MSHSSLHTTLVPPPYTRPSTPHSSLHSSLTLVPPHHTRPSTSHSSLHTTLVPPLHTRPFTPNSSLHIVGALIVRRAPPPAILKSWGGTTVPILCRHGPGLIFHIRIPLLACRGQPRIYFGLTHFRRRA